MKRRSDRSRQHAAPGLGIALDRLERGVDRGRVRPPGLDPSTRLLRPSAQLLQAGPDRVGGRRGG